MRSQSSETGGRCDEFVMLNNQKLNQCKNNSLGLGGYCAALLYFVLKLDKLKLVYNNQISYVYIMYETKLSMQLIIPNKAPI